MSMDIFTNLASKLTDYVKDKIKLRSLRKEDVQELLRINIESHQKIAHALDVMSDAQMRTWYGDLRPLLKKHGQKVDDVPDIYISQLRGKAANLERSRPLSSLRDANEAYAKLLEEISKKIDTVLEQDRVDIYNVRLSQLAVLGLIRQSDKVVNFSLYLYAYLVRMASHSVASLPKYREVFLLDNCTMVSKAVSDILDKKGSYYFLRDMNDLRSKQRDMIVGATGKFDFFHFTTTQGFSISFLDNLMSALSCLNIFGAAMDAWDDYRQEKYEKNKEIKEWLENHTALLRMDVMQMDKTSPEYQKTLDIIKAYDAKIAEYDQMIQEFEQED